MTETNDFGETLITVDESMIETIRDVFEKYDLDRDFVEMNYGIDIIYKIDFDFSDDDYYRDSIYSFFCVENKTHKIHISIDYSVGKFDEVYDSPLIGSLQVIRYNIYSRYDSDGLKPSVYNAKMHEDGNITLGPNEYHRDGEDKTEEYMILLSRKEVLTTLNMTYE